MVKGRQATYRLWVETEIHTERESLPGNIRQRIKRALDDLGKDPCPTASKILDTSDLKLPHGIEIRRLRMENWRILYAVHEDEGWVWALGIYRRPPYAYENLEKLISKLQ